MESSFFLGNDCCNGVRFFNECVLYYLTTLLLQKSSGGSWWLWWRGHTLSFHIWLIRVFTQAQEEPVLPQSSGSSLPPLAQPQLSLYPHIHNTPPGSDIVGGGGQSREDLGPLPPAPSTKPPITTNPYVVSWLPCLCSAMVSLDMIVVLHCLHPKYS